MIFFRQHTGNAVPTAENACGQTGLFLFLFLALYTGRLQVAAKLQRRAGERDPLWRREP